MKHTLAMLAAGSFSVAAISVAAAQHAAVTDQELMDKLKDAAPAAVLKGATVLNMSADGQMKAIQAGTNGWTCMDPGGAPMCADKAAMEWAKAWKAKGPAPQKLGFIYMLSGDNGTSNTDPFATEETPNNNWIKTGSHRPDEALCDVAGNALRTFDATRQVTVAWAGCAPPLYQISAAQPSVRGSLQRLALRLAT